MTPDIFRAQIDGKAGYIRPSDRDYLQTRLIELQKEKATINAMLDDLDAVALQRQRELGEITQAMSGIGSTPVTTPNRFDRDHFNALMALHGLAKDIGAGQILETIQEKMMKMVGVSA
jgi:hypothetical protein